MGPRRDRGCSAGGAHVVEELNPLRIEVEKFIVENDVDEKAAEYFRKTSPDIQQYAMSVGNLRSCRNPSSALMRRLLDARRGAFTGVAHPMSMQAITPIGAGC